MKRFHSIYHRVTAILFTAILSACGLAPDSDSTLPNETKRVHTPTVSQVPELADLEAREEANVLTFDRVSGTMTPQRPAPGLQKSMKLSSPVAMEMVSIRLANAPLERDRYAEIVDNAVQSALEHPVSTFSVDVDTGAYALVRRALNQGRLPASDAVRIEELINYFDYDYPVPQPGGQPFGLITEVSRTPWNPNTHLVHLGIKGVETARDKRPAANLVFLIDVSGSMESTDKLPLLKSAFRLLVKQLNGEDRVSLVVYAGASGVVLEPTPGDRQGKILAALEQLRAGGSTHGSAGIQLAYTIAEQERIANGINRVILATDGDFNVGTVNHEQLMDLIEQKRKQGITLTTLGFGQGNYNDYLMEQLADKGNGNYAYIDTINEAQKVLVDELTATLQTIAKDVKIQIEWNPAVVAEYRLIGYENRVLAREDFSNDKVDAGDIGAGHSVTALYEVTLVDSDARRLEPLRYQSRPATERATMSTELAFLRLRYKDPAGETSKLIEQPLKVDSIIDELKATSDNFRFSAAVAGFGQLLRGGRYTESFDYAAVAELARSARGGDRFGYRGEFLRLVSLAASLGS